MRSDRLMVQSGSFVATEMNIEIDTKWSGAKTFFASEGLVMLRAFGHRQAAGLLLRRHPPGRA